LPAEPGPAPTVPKLQGFNPYSASELSRILAGCVTTRDPQTRLNGCAEALRSRLFADGYINSRVSIQPYPPPGVLQVVAGTIEEIQVVSSSARLQRRLLKLLRPLQGGVLQLPRLTAILTQVQRLPGVGLLRTNLNRLGEDSSRALLLVTA
jgi:hemolysin activation/secretion protein